MDTREERSGTLKWAVLSVVFSASTAIATRTVDVQEQDGACVVLSTTCHALAADRSHLMATLVEGSSSYEASFKGLLQVNDGTATCAGVRQFEATNGALRILFDG